MGPAIEPAPEHASRRALVLHDRPLVIDLIELTLNHGLFTVRAASTLAEADPLLADWRPHLVVLDMDHDDSMAPPGPSVRRWRRCPVRPRPAAAASGR